MKKIISLSLLITVIGVLACTPYFYLSYGVHNDYRALDHQHTVNLLSGLKELMWHDESMHLMYIGRPVNAILFNLQQYTINTLDDLKLWRVVSCLTLLVALINFCAVSVCRARHKAPWVVFAYLLMFLAPSSQLYISWIANYVPGSLNILIASVAAIGLSFYSGKFYVKCTLWVCSFLLIFISFLNYPATSSAVIIPALVSYLYNPINSNRGYLKRSLVFYLAGLVLYFLVHKLFMFEFLSGYFADQFKSYDATTYKFGVGFNFGVLGIVLDFLMASITLFFFAKLKLVSVFMAFIVLMGLVVKYYALNQFKNNRSATFDLRAKDPMKLIAFSLILITLPIIAAPNGFFAYRIFFTQLAIVALFYSYAIYALYLIAKAYFKIGRNQFIIALIVLFSANAFLQNYTYAMQSYEEYEFVKKSIENQDSFNKIVVVLPNRYADFSNSDLYSDLKYTATNYSGFMSSILYFITDGLGIPRDSYEIESANSLYSDKYRVHFGDVQAGTLLIDMNALKGRIE